MDVDEKLLNLNGGAQEKAGNLQAAKREVSLGADSEESAGLSLREQVQLSRQEEAQSEEENKDNESTSSTPARLATDSWLKAAWTSLISSFGLTLFYIDLHFILNKVLGKNFFGPLGEEWVPAKFKRVGGDEVKKLNGLVKTTETMGCALLNLLALAIIIGIIVLISLIASVIDEPLKTLFKWLYDWVSKAIPDFITLFK